MMAGEGVFIGLCVKKMGHAQTKKAAVQAAFCGTAPSYLAAVLPYLLRNLSTRPPMVSTDFCVPV
jgi:hypothetical protein